MNTIPPGVEPMSDDQIEEIGHRTAWTYKHSAHKGASLYEFRLHTLIHNARSIEAIAARAGYEAGLEAAAKVCDDKERSKWEILVAGGSFDGFSPRDCAAAIRSMKGKP